MNIPIYRAKAIGSDEYVEGYLANPIDGKYFLEHDFTVGIEIDTSTLAIHFPDMVDKNGKKIFASLSEDGRWGDEFNAIQFHGAYKIGENKFVAKIPWIEWYDSTWNDFEVVGIHKGE